jgi:hypothetical protein
VAENEEMAQTVALETVTADDFAPYTGSVFTLCMDEGSELPLTLAEVRHLGRPGTIVGKGRAPFALEFDGPPDVPLPQCIYPLTHPVMGTLKIFLVPVGANADKRMYEAIFA